MSEIQLQDLKNPLIKGNPNSKKPKHANKQKMNKRVVDKQKNIEQQKIKGELKSSNIFNGLFFSWINPLLNFGFNHTITQSSIPNLPQQLLCKQNYQQLSDNFHILQIEKAQGWRLLKSISKTFKSEIFYCCLAVLILVATVCLTPIVTHMTIQYVQSRTSLASTQMWQGIGFFLTVFFVLLVKQLSTSHIWYNFFILTFNLANSLVLMIYEKTLKYPMICCKKYSTSDVINLNQVDIQRLLRLGYYLTNIIAAPLQLIIGMWILYCYIGKAFIPGFIVIMLSFVVTLYLTKLSSEKNKILLKMKDRRMKSTQQIFNFIRFIKVNAFQSFFKNKLQSKRTEQVKAKVKFNFMGSIFSFFFWVYNSIVLSVIFATFVFTGQQLTSAKAFTTMVLFKILQFSIVDFPMSVTQIVLAWQSIKRIEKFLIQKEIKKSNVKLIKYGPKLINQQNQEIAIKIINGDFEWELQQEAPQIQNKSKKTNIDNHIDDEAQIVVQNKKVDIDAKNIKTIKALKNINLQIKKQKLTMIIGDIGSGKTSILHAIMNQMNSLGKQPILIEGTIAFCSQKPWIMAGTVRQNILFTSKYQQSKLSQIIHLCCLQDDLKLLPNGIQTQIGQKGVNLSGGQKTRISFARALYSQKDIYLLDDLLSAVDMHVGDFIIKNTLIGYLRQNNKTILMPTHAVKYLKYADQIVVMDSGEIKLTGKYQFIKDNQIFMRAVNQCQQIQAKLKEQQQAKLKTKERSSTSIIQKVIQEQISILRKSRSQQKQRLSSDHISQSLIQVTAHKKPAKLIESLLIEQDKQQGQVQWKTYSRFLELAGGTFILFLIMVFYLIWILLSSYSSIIIQKWCQSLSHIDPQETLQYLTWFILTAIGGSLAIFVTMLLNIKQSQNLSKTCYKNAVDSLLSAGLNNFFNRVPTGRILNRLSKDIGKIDQTLMSSQRLVYMLSFFCLGNIGMCIYASSLYTILPLILVYYLCYRVKQYYMRTKIEVSRLQSISSSSILDGVITTMNGSSTIRAFNLQKKFISSQIKKIQINKKIRISKEAVEGWFSIRICSISLLFNMPVIFYCLFDLDHGAALIGLVMTYSLTLSQFIIQMIQCYAKFQTQLVSIQRINAFIDVKPQKNQLRPNQISVIKAKRSTKSNQTYSIQFNSVSLKYFEHHPNIVQKISFKVKSGQKVGIIGRTGAGKSTIFNSLLRNIECHQGQMLINQKPIRQYDLSYLRSQIMTIIDQDSVVFNSSFRQNLDPLNQYSDTQILQIAKRSGLQNLIQQRGGLNKTITNDSLSVGEKQLFSICRALLKKTEIVLIDQATANVDTKNDELIQQTMKTQFNHSTVLTIAHRISTLKNCDKILVLGNKRILQFGSPKDLLSRERSIYKQMLDKNDEQFLS